MTREEALKVANEMNQWLETDREKEALETLIPELAESEDERIRKRAIAILKQQRDYWSYDGPINKFPPATPRKDLVDAIDVALAYLEKQKDSVSNAKYIEDVAHAFEDGRKKGIEEEQKHYWKPTETDVALFNKTVTTNKALTPAERAQLDIIRSKFGCCRAINCNGIVQKEQKPLHWRRIEDATTQRTDDGCCVTSEKMLVKGWINDEDYRIVDENTMVNRDMLCIPVRELNAEQKEQKHILKFKVGDKVHLEGDDVNILTITGIEKDRYLTDISYGPILFGAEDIWERVEQKPAWSEGDKEEVKDLCNLVVAELGKYVGDDYWKSPWALDSTGVSFPLHFAKLGAEWQKGQKPVDYEAELKKCKDNPLYFYDKYVSIKHKPTEWSEEEEQMFGNILNHYSLIEAPTDGNGISKERYLAFIKSLRPQPKPEWSEEDEACIRNLESIIYYDKKLPNDTRVILGEFLSNLRPQPKKELSIEKAIQWLDDTFYFLDNSSGRGRDCEITTHDFDSLEEMYDSFRKAVIVDSEPHWRPSEEQMEALLNTLHPDDPYYCELKSLYEELKKQK